MTRLRSLIARSLQPQWTHDTTLESRTLYRVLWAWLSKTWARWEDALVFVKPSTVISS